MVRISVHEGYQVTRGPTIRGRHSRIIAALVCVLDEKRSGFRPGDCERKSPRTSLLKFPARLARSRTVLTDALYCARYSLDRSREGGRVDLGQAATDVGHPCPERIHPAGRAEGIETEDVCRAFP